jgi:hypothetical protein
MDNRFISFVIALAAWLTTPSAIAEELYFEAAAGPIFIDTPSKNVQPVVLDLRLGLSRPKHQFELALMSSVNDDKVNQLTVEVPKVVSLLWHFIPEQSSTLKVHTILGASLIEIDADLPGLGSSDDEYYGVSFGLGFEERFKSIPQLKLSADLMTLYLGEDLEIFTATLGVHYDF